MRTPRGRPLLPTLLLATVAPAPAGPQEPAGVPTIPALAAEVAVDFVARDKKGRLVRDLGPGDVEVFEDGVRQEIALFRLVTTAAPEEDVEEAGRPPDAAPVSPAAPGAPPAAREGAATAAEDDREAALALVFDRLSPVARNTACDAALEWVKRPAVEGRVVGVYRIDRGLDVLQPFTDERGPVMSALDDVRRAVPTAFSSSSDRERIRTLRHQIALVEGRVVSAAGPLSAAESDVPMVAPDSWRRSGPVKEVARRQLASELAMLQALEALERDQQGLATMNALGALVSGLRALPGRKAVVFFSEGLVLPDRVAGALVSVVAEANRGGVSFYAVDAAGLRTKSPADEMRRELVATADAIGASTESDSSLGARSGMTRLLERNEDMLRLDPSSGLGALARDTGGFLVRDTNDIARGLSRVEEELGAYYLLSYAPRNETWDGRYRRIELRSRRSGLSVQARRGYYAVRTPTPTPVLEHEAPALARLEAAPRSAGLPVRAVALHFPAEGGDSVLSIAAELPGSAPRLRPVEGSADLAQDFTVLALVRDASGRVVHKASRRYALTWPKSKAAELAASRVLFEREAVLPPGRYVVDVVAYDAQADLAGVARASLLVPAAGPAPRLSSLVVVGHTERRALGDASPLQYQGMHLYPTFGEVVSVSSGRPLAFLFTVRPGDRPPGEATVELLGESDAVRRAAVPLPRPDATGQVRVVGGLDLDGLAPGPYTLRLTLGDARSWESRTARVVLGP